MFNSRQQMMTTILSLKISFYRYKNWLTLEGTLRFSHDFKKCYNIFLSISRFCCALVVTLAYLISFEAVAVTRLKQLYVAEPLQLQKTLSYTLQMESFLSMDLLCIVLPLLTCMKTQVSCILHFGLFIYNLTASCMKSHQTNMESFPCVLFSKTW